MGSNIMSFGLIYETTYLNTGETYIGQTTKKGKKLNSYFGSGIRIKRIIKKHGKEVLRKKILCYCNTKEELNKMEIFYIKKENPKLNISVGGFGGNLGDEVNKKLKENHADFSKEKHPLWGKHHSEETKNKISLGNKGKIISLKNRKKHSKRMSGYKNPMFGKNSRDYMTDSAKIKQDENRRKKMSGKNNPNYMKTGNRNHLSKTVKCVETGEIFGGVREAARKLKIPYHSGISACCRGERKTANGYHWQYKE